jgi:hypothetical protein
MNLLSYLRGNDCFKAIQAGVSGNYTPMLQPVDDISPN